MFIHYTPRKFHDPLLTKKNHDHRYGISDAAVGVMV